MCNSKWTLPNFLLKDNFRIILAPKVHPTKLNALDAENIAFGFARAFSQSAQKTGNEWLNRFFVFARHGSLVIRALCISRADYVAHLQTLSDWQGKQLEAELVVWLSSKLPDYFWFTELSAPELFTATRHKIGEFIIAADTAMPTMPPDITMLLAIRLPGIVFKLDNHQLTPRPTALAGHTPLFLKHEQKAET